MLVEQVRLFLMGGGVGLFCAVLGAFVEYVLARRRGGKEDANLPGCMLLMAGMLGIVGLAAIGISYLLIGTVWLPIVVGAGVMFGFLCGFIVLFVVGLFLSSRRVDFLE